MKIGKKPHLFKFKPASFLYPGETLWAAVTFDESAGLYHWTVARTAELAYVLVAHFRYASRSNPYEKLKTQGWV